MRKYLLFTLLGCLFYAPGRTQTLAMAKDLIERSWAGLSEQDANFTKSGKLQLKHTIRLTLNTDNTVTGTSTRSFIMDGVTYTRNVTVKGYYTPSTWNVYIADNQVVSEAKLPSGLRWCNYYGTLSFYTNKTYPGYYLFKGNLDDDCGNKTMMEYTDHPY